MEKGSLNLVMQCELHCARNSKIITVYFVQPLFIARKLNSSRMRIQFPTMLCVLSNFLPASTQPNSSLLALFATFQLSKVSQPYADFSLFLLISILAAACHLRSPSPLFPFPFAFHRSLPLLPLLVHPFADATGLRLHDVVMPAVRDLGIEW